METIQVIHKAFEDNATTVAYVKVEENLSLLEKLEFAFRWTNNTEGSWSIKKEKIIFQDQEYINHDFNKDVEVVGSLKNGKGFRSTSVNDYMVYKNKTYKVAGCGFTDLNGDPVA